MITSPLSLPTDIHYLIIGCLRNDKQSLKLCSLVCSLWLSAARVHIFRTITIGRHRAWTEDPFHNLVQVIQERPGFGSLIHCLHLRNMYNEFSWDVAIFRAAVRGMPCLRKVQIEEELSCINWSPESMDPPFSTLEELVFRSPAVCSYFFLATICIFTEIHTLNVGGHTHVPDDPPSSFMPSRFYPHIPVINSLGLTYVIEDGISLIQDVIRHSPSHGRSLTSLACKTFDPNVIPCISSLLTLVGPHLLQLTLYTDIVDDYDVQIVGTHPSIIAPISCST